MSVMLLIVATMLLLPVPVAWFLARRLPTWTRRRTALIAPAPLPILLALPCIFVFGDAALSPSETCGVDACAMAMMFAVFGLVASLVGYVLGLIASALTVTAIRRGQVEAPVSDVFE